MRETRKKLTKRRIQEREEKDGSACAGAGGGSDWFHHLGFRPHVCSAVSAGAQFRSPPTCQQGPLVVPEQDLTPSAPPVAGSEGWEEDLQGSPGLEFAMPS